MRKVWFSGVVAFAMAVSAKAHEASALPLLPAAFVSPAIGANATASIVGTYLNEGLDLKGKPYSGIVEVSLVAGDVYHFLYTGTAPKPYGGIGLRQGDEVLTGWGSDDCRIARYRIDGSVLDGVWAEATVASSAGGREARLGRDRVLLERDGLVADDLTGTLVSSAESGAGYRGSGFLRPVLNPSTLPIYQLYLTLSPATSYPAFRSGIGFRDGDRLIVAWSLGVRCGPVRYRISERGRVLYFSFVDPFIPQVGPGVGTLVKKE